MASQFWDDLAEDLDDPEFLREYIVESVRVATIDQVMNTLLDAFHAAGLTKADLARAVHQQPSSVRRLLSSSHVNPTLGTLAEVAAALGLRITVEPLTASEREQITEPLLDGHAADAKALAKHLHTLRTKNHTRRRAKDAVKDEVKDTVKEEVEQAAHTSQQDRADDRKPLAV
jgi:transcriptional regulator with XRE-family HTH domain